MASAIDDLLPLDSPPETKAPAGLAGTRIAVVAAEESDDLVAVLESAGAAVERFEQTPNSEERAIEHWLGDLVDEKFHYVVFFSAQGVRLVCEMARQLGRESPVIVALKTAGLIAQGARTARALSEFGLDAKVRSAEKGAVSLLAALEGIDVSGRVVALQPRDTGTDRELIVELERLGATVHVEAPTTEPDAAARDLVDRLIAHELDKLVLFGAERVKWLWDAAIPGGKTGALREALASVAIVANESAADALRDRGVRATAAPGAVLGNPKSYDDVHRFFVATPKNESATGRSVTRLATADLELEAAPASSTLG
jgi:uroporphyrinogen-III synthase